MGYIVIRLQISMHKVLPLLEFRICSFSKSQVQKTKGKSKEQHKTRHNTQDTTQVIVETNRWQAEPSRVTYCKYRF
jgi:hypothetical protein